MQNLNKPWPCSFKNVMRNWLNFHYRIKKSEKFYIDGFFLSKVCFSWRISEGLCVKKLKGDAKFKGKLTCDLKNDITNLANFYASSRKPEKLHFDWILLSKAYKDLSEKIQNCVLWHWRVMQSLKKNWLLVPKKSWGISWIFSQLPKSTKSSLIWASFGQSIWGLS